MEKKIEGLTKEIVNFTQEKFKELYNSDIAGKVDTVKISEKRSLTYLSWSQGYKMMKEQDINSNVEFVVNPENKSYVFPEVVEVEVEEEVQIEESEKTVSKKEIWDSTTKEIKKDVDLEVTTVVKTTTTRKREVRTKKITTYMVKTKVTMFGLTLEMFLPVMDAKHNSLIAPTSRDISDSLMRCFAKNLALFGIGLPLYNKEDLEQFGIVNNGNAEESNLKKVKDFVMDSYRNNKDPRVVNAIREYSAKYGLISKMEEKNLEELANIIKGLSL